MIAVRPVYAVADFLCNCIDMGDDNKKGDTIADQRRADCKNESAHEGNTKEAREQDPKEALPGAKRPTAAEWNGMSRNQKRRWRQWHK